MELGFFTMPLHPPGSDLTQTLRDDLEQIVTLGRLGYKEAWVKGGDGSVPSGTAYRSIQLWPRNDNSRGQTSRLPLEPTAPHDA